MEAGGSEVQDQSRLTEFEASLSYVRASKMSKTKPELIIFNLNYIQIKDRIIKSLCHNHSLFRAIQISMLFILKKLFYIANYTL